MYGISVYPYKEEKDKTIEYIIKAGKLGYKRIFTNLINVESEDDIQIIREIAKYAKTYNMELIVDVNPEVFKTLNLDITNLQYFKDLGVTGIRLDSTFDGLVESLLTYDQSGLYIEMNISNDTGYLDNVFSYQPNKKQIIGCHNFYPQRYTGLDLEYFRKCSSKYKKMGLRTAAFVNSHTADHGPHIFDEGLCTLEMHRDLDIVTQAKHLIAEGTIDDIIIANAFASDDELKRLIELDQSQLILDIEFNEDVTDIEKEIVLQNQHFNRGDISSYMIRSTFVKLKYKDKQIKQNNCKDKIELGDVTIGNETFGQYKGELNIVKKSMDNTNKYKNVVGKITNEELFLIDYIHPWTKFLFREKR